MWCIKTDNYFISYVSFYIFHIWKSPFQSIYQPSENVYKPSSRSTNLLVHLPTFSLLTFLSSMLISCCSLAFRWSSSIRLFLVFCRRSRFRADPSSRFFTSLFRASYGQRQEAELRHTPGPGRRTEKHSCSVPGPGVRSCTHPRLLVGPSGGTQTWPCHASEQAGTGPPGPGSAAESHPAPSPCRQKRQFRSDWSNRSPPDLQNPEIS